MPAQATWLIYIVLIGFMVYMMIIRPNNKRMREQQAVINALTPGTRVLLNTGIFATVTVVGERQAVVELAPGMEVSVLKQSIIRVVSPDDEEFEFADEYEYVGHDRDDKDFLPAGSSDVIEGEVMDADDSQPFSDDSDGIGNVPEEWSASEKDSEN